MGEKRILVVDDHNGSRAALVELLSEEGHYVKEAASGLEAVARAQSWPPDVAIVDYHLPDIDGVAVTRALVKNDSDCSVIFVSGTAELEAEGDGSLKFCERGAEAIAAGAATWLPKPIDIDRLLDAL